MTLVHAVWVLVKTTFPVTSSRIALPSRRDEFQRVNGNGNEFSVCEFRTGYAPCLVHDGKQTSTEQRVMVVGITWKNVFNERHRLF